MTGESNTHMYHTHTPTDLTPSLCCCSSTAPCWTSAVLSPAFSPTHHFGSSRLSVAAGSSPTWTTRSWTTLCPESMCCTCDPVDRCSSSSHTSGSSPASPAARIRHTTSSPTSLCASSSWSVSVFINAHVLAHLTSDFSAQ